MDHPLAGKYYLITSVAIDDVVAKMGQEVADQLDDDDMRYLADKMANAYLECCFWIALDCLVNEAILPEKERGREYR